MVYSGDSSSIHRSALDTSLTNAEYSFTAEQRSFWTSASHGQLMQMESASIYKENLWNTVIVPWHLDLWNKYMV